MPFSPRFALLLLPCTLLAGQAAHAEPKTICTITVNSPDEWQAFRARLPKGDYNFVELIEKGRPDWLRSSCQKGVQCDVLVVSGHFNAGETFYSDSVSKDDHLRVDELERASCSDSCPGLFAKLKEVYLFGCESLNPDASKYSSSYGESGRDRMRRVFAGVPSIYGFSGAAPVGPVAAKLIGGYFSAGGAPIGTGHANSRFLSAFSNSSMTRTSGVSEAESGYRRQVCPFYDERLSPARKLAMVHAMMKRDMNEAKRFFERIEALVDSLTPEERQDPAFVQALSALASDSAARERYLAVERAESVAGRRARMVVLARDIGWLPEPAFRNELATLVTDLLARPAMGYAEVDLICSLNDDGELDGLVEAPRASGVMQSAAIACLGDAKARTRTLQALASGDEREVQGVQTYLRYRPIADAGELRDVTRVVARMPAGPAKIRALDALGRLNITDGDTLRELVESFAASTSASVQRAIAEIFIRSDTKAIARPEVVAVLQKNRLTSTGGDKLIDAAIRRLQAS